MSEAAESRDQFDVDRLTQETFVASVEFHDELASTNDRALELCRDESLVTPQLVWAARQTAGRGRGANRWWAADGALTFSLVVDTGDWALPEARLPRISLTVGLAVCEALASHLMAGELRLKWPNDVYLDGRKLCGILVEVPPRAGGRLVLGVGINVNNSFAAAPVELASIATSLSDASGRAHDISAVLCDVLRQLERELSTLGDEVRSLADRWQPYCYLRGRVVEVTAGRQVTRGLCVGIDADGALLLQDESRRHRCLSGTVELVE